MDIDMKESVYINTKDDDTVSEGSVADVDIKTKDEKEERARLGKSKGNTKCSNTVPPLRRNRHRIAKQQAKIATSKEIETGAADKQPSEGALNADQKPHFTTLELAQRAEKIMKRKTNHEQKKMNKLTNQLNKMFKAMTLSSEPTSATTLPTKPTPPIAPVKKTMTARTKSKQHINHEMRHISNLLAGTTLSELPKALSKKAVIKKRRARERERKRKLQQEQKKNKSQLSQLSVSSIADGVKFARGYNSASEGGASVSYQTPYLH